MCTINHKAVQVDVVLTKVTLRGLSLKAGLSKETLADSWEETDDTPEEEHEDEAEDIDKDVIAEKADAGVWGCWRDAWIGWPEVRALSKE